MRIPYKISTFTGCILLLKRGFLHMSFVNNQTFRCGHQKCITKTDRLIQKKTSGRVGSKQRARLISSTSPFLSRFISLLLPLSFLVIHILPSPAPAAHHRTVVTGEDEKSNSQHSACDVALRSSRDSSRRFIPLWEVTYLVLCC